MLVWPHVPGPLCWCDVVTTATPGHTAALLATPDNVSLSRLGRWAGRHLLPPHTTHVPAPTRPSLVQPGPAAPCPGEGEPGGCRGVAAHSSGVLGTEELGLISAAGRCAHNWAAGLRAARCQPASSGTGSGQAEHCDTRHGRAHRTHDHHRECSKIG